MPDARILHMYGSAAFENAGSEIWIDDVSGDGIGDLMIARQNFSAGSGREGVGAISIVIGGPALATHAATFSPIITCTCLALFAVALILQKVTPAT